MSFLSVLKTCHNDQLPNLTRSTHEQDPSIPTQPALIPVDRQKDDDLVPFYIHLPDQLPGLTLIKPSPLASPTIKAKTRRTSSSTYSRLNIQSKPLSSYLSTFNSPFDESDDRFSNPFDHPIQSAPYDQNDRTRDSSQPIGFLRAPVLKALVDDNQHMIQSHSKPCWKLFYPSHLINQGAVDTQEQPRLTTSNPIDPPALNVDQTLGNPHPSGLLPSRVSFEDWINESESRVEARLEHIDRLVRGWKEVGLFPDQLSGWRNEEYSIYGPKDPSPDEDQARLPGSFMAFKIERAAVGLFGFLSFGAHLTAYLKKDDQYFFWIPRRSPTKPTWPSKLDNTAAGGIPSGETAYETIVRECFEEASLEEEFVRSRIRPTGLISYTHRNPHGWIQPEIQYTYDLELPSDNSVIPRPNDGEAEDFKLMSLDEVMQALKAHEFKPNCAAVLIDFFVRHGILNELNEPNYCLISTLVKQPPFLPLP